MLESAPPSDLRRRQDAYHVFCKRFQASRPNPLIAVHNISPELFKKLQIAAALYLSQCLPKRPLLLDERELLAALEHHQHEIPNMTPNGMMVPKRHNMLQYNLLVRAFMDIIGTLEIGDLISSWHIPLNLRLKLGKVNEKNLLRHHPTEHIHSDSWAGESSESITTLIPIFGDLDRNHIRFYEPPPDFSEDWLRPRPTYLDGANIAQAYGLLPFIPRKGQLILADFATLHASTLLPGAGPRVSIDTTFVPHRSLRSSHGIETIHPWREGERMSHQDLADIGESCFFSFPDEAHKWVDSQGGFKHPTHLKRIELL